VVYPSWPYRYHVCYRSAHSSPWLYEMFSSFWFIAIPVMSIIAPAFMWPDIIRMYHYVKKRSLARKIGKVRPNELSLLPFGLIRRLAIVHVEVQNRVNSNICSNSTIEPDFEFPNTSHSYFDSRRQPPHCPRLLHILGSWLPVAFYLVCTLNIARYNTRTRVIHFT
jgi:hypothetical protein